MPLWIALDEPQLQQLAKDIIGDVRRTIKNFENRLMEVDQITLDPHEKQLLLKYIAEMLTGEFENGKNNTKRDET